MIQSNFREWTLDKLDETFGTKEVRSLSTLEELVAYKYEINTIEKKYLTRLSDTYKYLGGESWNETELENKIISPLIVYSEIDNKAFSYFLERDLSTTIDKHLLTGRVDGMIATGYRNPKKPYFCLSEYKKAKDPNGDPQGQVLIAMLVAQHLNKDELPIYGSYIVGRQWVFTVLDGLQYTFSDAYTIDNNDILDVYRILKGLKWHIEQRIKIEEHV